MMRKVALVLSLIMILAACQAEHIGRSDSEGSPLATPLPSPPKPRLRPSAYFTAKPSPESLATEMPALTVPQDIGSPGYPHVAGVLSNRPVKVTACGSSGNACLSTGHSFAVIDLSKPGRPVPVGSLLLPGAIQAMTSAQHFVFLTVSEVGLVVVDLSDRAHPTVVGFFDIPHKYAFMGDIVVIDDLAYVGIDDALHILNVHEPSAPFEVASYQTPGFARSMIEVDSRLYVGSRDCTGGPHLVPTCFGKLTILDITSRDAPALLGAYSTALYAGYSGNSAEIAYDGIVDLAVSGDYAFLAEGDSGMSIVDISDPTQPFLAGHVPGDVWGVVVEEPRVYVAAGAAALRVLDISEPAAPTEVDHCDIPGFAREVALAGKLVLVVDDTSTLWIVKD